MTSPTNLDRALRAELVLLAHCTDAACDADDALADLLADLLHWSSLTGRDFNAALERALMHHEAEAGGAS